MTNFLRGCRLVLALDTKERLNSLKSKIAHFYLTARYFNKMAKLLLSGGESESKGDADTKTAVPENKVDGKLAHIMAELRQMYQDLSKAVQFLEPFCRLPGELKELSTESEDAEVDLKLKDEANFWFYQKRLAQYNSLARNISIYLKRTQDYLHTLNDSMLVSTISSAAPTFTPEIISKKHMDVVADLMDREMQGMSMEYKKTTIPPKSPSPRSAKSRAAERNPVPGTTGDDTGSSHSFIAYSELGDSISLFPDREVMEQLKDIVNNNHREYNPRAFLTSGTYWNMEIPRYMPMFAHEYAHANVINQTMMIWKTKDMPDPGEYCFYPMYDQIHREMDDGMNSFLLSMQDTEIIPHMEEFLTDLCALTFCGPSYLHALFLHVMTSEPVESQVRFVRQKLVSVGPLGIIRIYVMNRFLILTLAEYREIYPDSEFLKELSQHYNNFGEFLLSSLKKMQHINDTTWEIIRTLFVMGKKIGAVYYQEWKKLNKDNNHSTQYGLYNFLNCMINFEQASKKPKDWNIFAVLANLENFKFKQENSAPNMSETLENLLASNPNTEICLGLNLIWLRNMNKMHILFKESSPPESKEEIRLVEGRTIRFFHDLVNLWRMIPIDKPEERTEILKNFLNFNHNLKTKEIILIDFLIDNDISPKIGSPVSAEINGNSGNNQNKDIEDIWLISDYDHMLINHDYKGRSSGNLIDILYNYVINNEPPAANKPAGDKPVSNNSANAFLSFFQALPIVVDDFQREPAEPHFFSINTVNNDDEKKSKFFIVSRISLEKKYNTFQILNNFWNSDHFKLGKILRSTSWDSAIFIWKFDIDSGLSDEKKAALNQRFLDIMHLLNKNKTHFETNSPAQELIDTIKYSITSFGFIRKAQNEESDNDQLPFDSRSRLLISKEPEKDIALSLMTEISVFSSQFNPFDYLNRTGENSSVHIPSGFNTIQITRKVHDLFALEESVYTNWALFKNRSVGASA